MKLYPFDPDYVVPTSEVLRDWLDWNHLSTSVAAVASYGRGTASHRAAIGDLDKVLNGGRVDARVADLLCRVTSIPASFWLAFEHNYRTGLAKGKSVSR